MKRLRGRAAQRRAYRVGVRDEWTCRACGLITAPGNGEADHDPPLKDMEADGNEWDIDGMQWLCKPCHAIKTERDMGYTVKGCDASGWALARED